MHISTVSISKTPTDRTKIVIAIQYEVTEIYQLAFCATSDS